MSKEKPRWKDGIPYTRTTASGEVEVQFSILRLAWLKLTIIKGHTQSPTGFTGFVDPVGETYTLVSAKTLDEAKSKLLGLVHGKLARVMQAIDEVESVE